jgi:hypothetical protein
MSKFLSNSAWRENDRVRVDGSATVVDAAMDGGVTNAKFRNATGGSPR